MIREPNDRRLFFSLLSMDTDFDLESLVNVEQTCVFSHLESPKPS